MRLLAYVHRYPPLHNAGAEWALHHTLRWLHGRGHEVRVCTSLQATSEFEGVLVSPRASAGQLRTWAQWADLIITHLDVTRFAVQLGARHSKPIVHLVHNHRQLAYHRVPRHQLAVFNSRWLAEATGWPGPQMVLHPPCPPDIYLASGRRGGAVLMSNPIPAKGAHLVYALASELSRLDWLIVRGAYGPQVAPPDLPHLSLVDQSPSMRDLLQQAALVLMPSSYESWGRVAVEAALMGIPTIASDQPGLLETGVPVEHIPVHADPAGSVYPTPESLRRWSAAVERWHGDWRAGARARDRAFELWEITTRQLAELEERLGAYIGAGR